MNIKRTFTTLSFLIIFTLPITRYYDITGTTFGLNSLLKIVLLVLLLVLFFLNRKRINNRRFILSRRFYLVFALFGALITGYYEIFASLRGTSVTGLLVLLATALIIYLLYYSTSDTKSIFKIYSVFVYVLVAIYFFQWAIHLFGMRINFKLPLPFSDSYYMCNRIVFGMEDLPTSLFSERAHFCEYILPFITICLFKKNKVKSDYAKAIFMSLIAISTISGNGIIGVAIVWALYLFFFNSFKATKKAFVAFVGFGVIIIAYFILMSIPSFYEMFNILFVNRSGTGSSYTKAAYRIYRGFDLFAKLPLKQKLFGVGFGHMELFSRIYNIKSVYDKSAEYEFFNAIAQVMLYFGLFGLALFGLSVFFLFVNKSHLTRALIIVFIALAFSSQFLLQDQHVFLISLIIVSYERKSAVVSIVNRNNYARSKNQNNYLTKESNNIYA